jgi:streptogramin lyase
MFRATKALVVATLAMVALVVPMSAGALDAEVTQIPYAGNGTTDGVAVGSGGVWIVDQVDNVVTRLDPRTDEVLGTIDVPASVVVATGEGAVWVGAEALGMKRIDPGTMSVDGGVDGKTLGTDADEIVTGAGSVWVASNFDPEVVRVDPDSLEVQDTYDVGTGTYSLAFGQGAVWVTHLDENTITRIDVESGDVTTLPENPKVDPAAIAVGAGGVWTEGSLDGLCRLPASGRAPACVTLPGDVSGLATRGGTVWVSSTDGKVFEVDGRGKKPKLVATIGTDGQSLGDLAVGAGAVWVVDPVARDSSIFEIRL